MICIQDESTCSSPRLPGLAGESSASADACICRASFSNHSGSGGGSAHLGRSWCMSRVPVAKEHRICSMYTEELSACHMACLIPAFCINARTLHVTRLAKSWSTATWMLPISTAWFGTQWSCRFWTLSLRSLRVYRAMGFLHTSST